MGWKDSFHVQEKDKKAITALLSLILISGGVYMCTNGTKSDQTTDQIVALAEFDKFQEQLKPIYSHPIANTAKKENKPTPSKTKLSEGQTLDLNSVNEKALKKIPGIGDTFAKRIIEYRELLGGFTNLEQLLEVKGISTKKFDKINSFLVIKKDNRKLKINSLKSITHPYISQIQAEEIIECRKNNGKIRSIGDIESLSQFTPRDIDRLEKYISFN